jgi:DNA-binding LacI/PurR family transcriptional regulator/ABC-type glycerol-3-phosphate transport system substrate-binding protein
MAGVSHGTVSNVLNGRPGVAPEKVHRVLEAVERLGYVPYQGAKNLKTSASTSVAVILPNIADPNFAQIFTGIERILSEAGYAVSLYISAEIQAKEWSILAEVHRNRVSGIIIVPCSPDEDRRYERLAAAGIKLVFVEREHSSHHYNFVEYNSYALVRAAVDRLLARGIREIVLVLGPLEYSSEQQCLRAFRDAYKALDLEPVQRFVRVTNFDRESAFREAISVFEGPDIPEAVITSSTRLMEGVLRAYGFMKSLFPIKPEFMTLAEESWTADQDEIPRQLYRPAIRLGETAAELLLEDIRDGNFHSPRRVRVDGAISPERQPEPARRRFAPSDPLRILMLEGSHARAIAALLPDFQVSTGIEVEFETRTYSEIYPSILEESCSRHADVVQVDIPWLPELTRQGLLLDLSTRTEADPESIRNFLPVVLDTYARVDGRFYAFPFVFGAQLLFYRKDLFEDESIRLEFREKFRTELRPPRTWPEYNAVARFFSRGLNPDSPVEYGTTLGGRFSSGAVCEYLPRQWGFGGDTFSPEGEVILESPENRWALENYKESFLYASPGSPDYWWDDQFREFAGGGTAMMILFVAHAAELMDRKKSSIVGRIGYTGVPGGKSLLGGWSLAIPASCRDPDRAFAFLRWATGPELAFPSTVLGGTTLSVELYKSSELLSVYPWFPTALECFDTGRKRVLPRRLLEAKFREYDFETILGGAVHACIVGELSAEDALSQAAEAIRSAQALRPPLMK